MTFYDFDETHPTNKVMELCCSRCNGTLLKAAGEWEMWEVVYPIFCKDCYELALGDRE
jgi:hypothetical protein